MNGPRRLHDDPELARTLGISPDALAAELARPAATTPGLRGRVLGAAARGARPRFDPTAGAGGHALLSVLSALSVAGLAAGIALTLGHAPAQDDTQRAEDPAPFEIVGLAGPETPAPTLPIVVATPEEPAWASPPALPFVPPARASLPPRATTAAPDRGPRSQPARPARGQDPAPISALAAPPPRDPDGGWLEIEPLPAHAPTSPPLLFDKDLLAELARARALRILK